MIRHSESGQEPRLKTQVDLRHTPLEKTAGGPTSTVSMPLTLAVVTVSDPTKKKQSIPADNPCTLEIAWEVPMGYSVPAR